MVRTQVQLTEEQAAAIRRMAAEQNISLAEIVRRSIDDFIRRTPVAPPEDLWARAKAAAGFVQGGPPDLAENHDDYLPEAFEE